MKKCIEILMRRDREGRRKIGDFHIMREHRTALETHVVAVFTLFSAFWRVLESCNSLEKSRHIILSLDPLDSFSFTDFRERFFSFLIFCLRLNIRIIPECKDIILILQIHQRYCRIRTTADMEEESRFFLEDFSDRFEGKTMKTRDCFGSEIGLMRLGTVSFMFLDPELRIQERVGFHEFISKYFRDDRCACDFFHFRISSHDTDRIARELFEGKMIISVD